MISLRKFAGAGLLVASSLAFAQTPYTDDSVYRGLGGKEGIARIVESLFEITLADPRIKETFDGFDIPVVKERLAEQMGGLAAVGLAIYAAGAGLIVWLRRRVVSQLYARSSQ